MLRFSIPKNLGYVTDHIISSDDSLRSLVRTRFTESVYSRMRWHFAIFHGSILRLYILVYYPELYGAKTRTIHGLCTCRWYTTVYFLLYGCVSASTTRRYTIAKLSDVNDCIFPYTVVCDDVYSFWMTSTSNITK